MGARYDVDSVLSPSKKGSTNFAVVAIGLAAAAFVATTLFFDAPARAHGWYPKECCNDMDCAAVESMSRVVQAGRGVRQLVVTSKHGKAIVPEGFPVRESKDGRMHVCMRYDPFGKMDVICLFMPPVM